MKTKEFRKDNTTPKVFELLYIFLSLFFMIIVSGCMTPMALELADEKSAPSMTYTNWNINRVESAVEQENGDLSVYVELENPYKPNKTECYVINLPVSSLLSNAMDSQALGFPGDNKIELPDRNTHNQYIGSYYYPIDKEEKNSQKFESHKLSGVTTLPILRLTVPDKDRARLYTLLNGLRKQGGTDEKLYEVRFIKNAQEASNGMDEAEAMTDSETLLIYWPPETKQLSVQPLCIAGGYTSKDESTHAYYLLVPPAIMVDLILIGLSGWMGPG